ncbi:Rha family transcriptional regulator [Mannheimia haemolytica]|nr:Rha family transcriptional regulator [Mannheimia haemolytica]
MTMKQTIIEMIESCTGGKSAVAGFLGFTESELNNRLYQTKGQRFKKQRKVFSMNQLLNISEQKSSITMSSREIAELCEKEHRHVLRDIRAYVGAIIQMERGINVKSLDWSGKEGVELFGHTQAKDRREQCTEIVL